jgi:glycogen operon protein
MTDDINIPNGRSFPLGATYYDVGVNFCIFSKNASSVSLLLFDHAEDEKPSAIYKLDPVKNRTFYYWHIFVEGLQPGQLYGYRIDGPYDPKYGHFYDPDKLLLDPYARSIVCNGNYSRIEAQRPGKNWGKALKGAVIDPASYDWEGDLPIQRPYSSTVIYEMHVSGFTANPNSGVPHERRGKYSGIIDKIPYLKDLGITAVELMPVHQFDPQDAQPTLSNYWGYSPVGFFAPHNGYAMSCDPVDSTNEFRDLVKALHKAGIEVILDVVFNHTNEAGVDGPILSMRGIENKAYYMFDVKKSSYRDYTGCGNTLNTNHSIVRRMIMDSLRTWVTEYHVDGFRFDLASVLSRDESGEPLQNPPVLWEIESDPVLAGTKIIAEAWDAAGLYQVGTFIGDRWAEWNGKFRDHVRRFIKGEKSMVSKFASKLIASPDIYTDPKREINRSINFVTCHDGFTLYDLVSYNNKHNMANLENNRDGSNHNLSWNCGTEGETDDPEILALRQRQIKNFLTLTFFAQGTPMLLMGDEVSRSQRGNNNAYCQDNEISWFDWRLVEKNSDLLGFTKKLIHKIQNMNLFQLENLLATPDDIDEPHITWHGIKLGEPDWSEHSHSLAFTMSHPGNSELLHVMVNAFWNTLNFELPQLNDGLQWRRIINTHLNSPNDIVDVQDAHAISKSDLDVESRTVVVLEGISKS